MRTNGPDMEIISMYVDDLGLFTSTKEGMARIKLNSKFTMTDLEEMRKILELWVQDYE